MSLLKKRLMSKKTILSILMGLIILFFLLRNFDLSALVEMTRSIGPMYLIILIVLSFLSFPVIALRWRLQLENAGLKIKVWDITEIVILFYFINSILPAKLGEFYRAYLIKKNYKFSLSKTMGTIFVERLLDMIFLIIFLVISVYATFKGVIPDMITISLYVSILLIVFLIAFIFMIRFFKKYITNKLSRRLKSIYNNFERGISTCLHSKNLHKIIFYSFLRWLITILPIYVLILAINLDVSFFVVVFIVLASSLASLVPITPAGLGVGEVTITGILIMFGIEKNLAMSASILIRVFGYWYVLIMGGIFFIFSKKK